VKAKFLLALAVISVGQLTAFAAEYLPELDDPSFSHLHNLSEVEKRYHIAEKLFADAVELRKQGKYQEALEKIDRALKLSTSSFPRKERLERANLLFHLDRKTEAARMLEDLFSKSGADQEIATAYFDYLFRERKYREAVAASRQFSESYQKMDELYPSLIARSLDAVGDRDEAIKLAEKSYYHFAHIGSPTDKLKEFLTSVGKPPADPIVRNKQNNDKVLARIKPLLDNQKLMKYSELKKMFPDDKESNYIHLPEGIVVEGADTFDIPQALVYFDTDTVSLTREDIEQVYGPGEFHEGGRWMHGWHLPSLTYENREPSASFRFAKGGVQPLSELRVKWASAPKPAPHPQTKMPTMSEIDAKLDAVEHDIKKSNFRKATEELRVVFELGNDGDLAKYYKQLHRKRTLFIAAYKGLKLDDVAEFIQRAPYEHVWIELILSYDRPELIGWEEYMRTVPWMVTYQEPGEYFITSLNHSIPICVPKESPNFSKFQKYIGTMKIGEQKKIGPLPPDLVDRHVFGLPID